MSDDDCNGLWGFDGPRIKKLEHIELVECAYKQIRKLGRVAGNTKGVSKNNLVALNKAIHDFGIDRWSLPRRNYLSMSPKGIKATILIESDKQQTPLSVQCGLKDEVVLPTLFSLWRCIDEADGKRQHVLPEVIISSGVSKFIIGGADLMLPGIEASFNGYFIEKVVKGQIVAICVRNNPYPIAIGIAAVNCRGIASCGLSGRGVIILHCFGDLLWHMAPIVPTKAHDESGQWFTATAIRGAIETLNGDDNNNEEHAGVDDNNNEVSIIFPEPSTVDIFLRLCLLEVIHHHSEDWFKIGSRCHSTTLIAEVYSVERTIIAKWAKYREAVQKGYKLVDVDEQAKFSDLNSFIMSKHNLNSKELRLKHGSDKQLKKWIQHFATRGLWKVPSGGTCKKFDGVYFVNLIHPLVVTHSLILSETQYPENCDTSVVEDSSSKISIRTLARPTAEARPIFMSGGIDMKNNRKCFVEPSQAHRCLKLYIKQNNLFRMDSQIYVDDVLKFVIFKDKATRQAFKELDVYLQNMPSDQLFKEFRDNCFNYFSAVVKNDVVLKVLDGKPDPIRIYHATIKGRKITRIEGISRYMLNEKDVATLFKNACSASSWVESCDVVEVQGFQSAKFIKSTLENEFKIPSKFINAKK
eukprot:GHVH01015632.1.p1 GENE.GHVH01015632.1~~GHVH01015632.1.p1  ORF type:complete len:638 (+),score=81.75 GHVH01015632.1:76-1989(+)